MKDSFRIKLLPVIHANGPTQMGIDLALLDYAETEPNTIWLRAYTWSAPTLSLGYFQAWRELPELLRNGWADVAVVRRPTGGGAIWHDDDLTYAVVVPANHSWANHSRTLYQAIHDSLAKLFIEDGASVARRSQLSTFVIGNSAATSSPFLCFEDGDADDLLLGGHKIVGGAQRRRPWATLQHGSIHWQRSTHPQASQLPGLIDLAPTFHEPLRTRWATKLGHRLATQWQLPIEETALPAMATLAAHGWSNRLRQPEWLMKR